MQRLGAEDFAGLACSGYSIPYDIGTESKRPPRATARRPSGCWPERVREISRGTYRRPAEQVSFEGLAQAFLKDAEANVRDTTFKDYRGNLNRHLLP